MKRSVLALLLIIGATFSIKAQDISEVFLTMPETIIPGLEAEQKYQLISKDSDSVNVETSIYEDIVRTGFSDNFIALKTSNAGTTQIKLLPLINDSKIICVIKTVSAKMSDSDISFYTTKWMPIETASLLPRITLDWFIKVDVDRNSQEFKNAMASIDLQPFKIETFAENTTLSIETDLENYLSDDDYKRVKPFLIEEAKKLNWDKISYK